MSVQQLDLPASFNGEVRLFPLPDVVMFPRNVLPLHIFESRYREMLEDAVQSDDLITMATLEPGYTSSDYYSRPPLAPVVCVGRVTAHKITEKGTYDLVVIGLQRARIEHEIEPVRSFRRAKVTLLPENPGSEEDRNTVRAALARDLRQTVPGADKLVAEFEDGNVSLASLTDILAFHLTFDRSFKLKLLGEVNVVKRANLLLAALTSDGDEIR